MITIRFMVDGFCSKDEFISKVNQLKDYILALDYDKEFLVDSKIVSNEDINEIFTNLIEDLKISSKDVDGIIEYPKMEDNMVMAKEYKDIEFGSMEFNNSFFLNPLDEKSIEFLSVKLSNVHDYVSDFDDNNIITNQNLDIQVDMKDSEGSYKEFKI